MSAVLALDITISSCHTHVVIIGLGNPIDAHGEIRYQADRDMKAFYRESVPDQFPIPAKPTFEARNYLSYL